MIARWMVRLKDQALVGIKGFSMFRPFEELRTLAVRLAEERQLGGPPVTEARRILAGFQRAHHRLKAVLMDQVKRAACCI